MGYQVEIIEPNGTTHSISDQFIRSVDIKKPHTAMADAKVDLPWDPTNIDPLVTAVNELRVLVDGSTLFRGYLERADHNQQAASTTIDGGTGDDIAPRDDPAHRPGTDDQGAPTSRLEALGYL